MDHEIRSEDEFIKKFDEMLRTETNHRIFRDCFYDHFFANNPMIFPRLSLLKYFLDHIEGLDYNYLFRSYCADKNGIPVLEYLMKEYNININEFKESMENAIKYGGIDIVKFLVTNGYDIVKRNDETLTSLLWNGNEMLKELLHFFIDNGSIITDSIIEQSFDFDTKFLELFMEYGIELDRIVKLFWENLDASNTNIVYSRSVFNILVFFNKHGIDINDSINNYLLNKN